MFGTGFVVRVPRATISTTCCCKPSVGRQDDIMLLKYKSRERCYNVAPRFPLVRRYAPLSLSLFPPLAFLSYTRNTARALRTAPRRVRSLYTDGGALRALVASVVPLVLRTRQSSLHHHTTDWRTPRRRVSFCCSRTRTYTHSLTHTRTRTHTDETSAQHRPHGRDSDN